MNLTACRLRELREKHHFSQQKVADYLGISRTAYNKYESGAIRPTRKLDKLAALFGVSADYILGRADEIPEGRSKILS
ncbi:MAG: helix-turn-helix transcriptional regulator [Bacteroidales bacterium]|nr:helix-turn-helix transcriptional regulator [Bacteroidales bacterium]